MRMVQVDSRVRIDAVRTIQTLTVQVIGQLSRQEWGADSAAEGWTVHDVIAHMSSALHELFGVLMVQIARSKDIEALNETPVEVRRKWSDSEVAAEYRCWAPRARRVLQVSQLPLIGSLPVPMAELGRFAARVLPSAIAFDTHTHLYHDIGPALSRPLPAPAPSVIATTLEWMMLVAANIGSSAVPLAEGQGVRFSFTGPGGADWLLRRTGGALHAEPWRGEAVAGTVTGAAADFPAWGTHRGPWRNFGLRIDGDEGLAEAVLDALRIV